MGQGWHSRILLPETLRHRCSFAGILIGRFCTSQVLPHSHRDKTSGPGSDRRFPERRDVSYGGSG